MSGGPKGRHDVRAVRFTRWWVRCYTAGLEPDVRDRRRGEIDSDLWEHRADSEAEGVGHVATALEMFARCVLGTPADLAWRRRVSSARRNNSPASTEGGPTMKD